MYFTGGTVVCIVVVSRSPLSATWQMNVCFISFSITLLSLSSVRRYKERVRERHLKALDPSSTMKFIDTKNWMFLKSGLDDFRNGMPPPATDDIFIKVLATYFKLWVDLLY